MQIKCGAAGRQRADEGAFHAGCALLMGGRAGGDGGGGGPCVGVGEDGTGVIFVFVRKGSGKVQHAPQHDARSGAGWGDVVTWCRRSVASVGSRDGACQRQARVQQRGAAAAKSCAYAASGGGATGGEGGGGAGGVEGASVHAGCAERAVAGGGHGGDGGAVLLEQLLALQRGGGGREGTISLPVS